MEIPLERLFARWREHGDAQALAEVFDRTAPRLLALAIHLCGSAADAEDLLQTTWLTALERARDFDPERPLEPWLSGILANKARLVRREHTRRPDPERLLARAVETPPDAAQRRELSGVVAEALDALPEPYRQVLLLRLRHGFELADVAHVLGRSPGAVRVQLHRGLEKLRERLPAGLSLSALAAVPPGRGLVAVREAVLAEAGGALVTAGGIATWTGGVLMAKKLLALAAGLAALWAAIVWTRGEPATAGELARVELEPAAERVPEAPAVAPLTGEPMPEGPAPTAERDAVASAIPDGLRLSGVVLRGVDGEPVAGARVELHAVRESRAADLARERWGLLEQTPTAVLRPRASWPCTVQDDADPEPHGLGSLQVYDAPRSGAEPLVVALSDALGRFELAAPDLGGVLLVSAPGFGRRVQPVTDPAQPVTVELWQAWTLSGRVVDGQGEPLGRPLALLFLGDRPTEGEAGYGDPHGAGFFDAWEVTAGEDGEFELELGADEVVAAVRSAGWRITPFGRDAESGESRLFPNRLRRAELGERGRVTLVARPAPALVVFDALTREPIEQLDLFAEDTRLGMPRWSGRFHAPGGVLPLADGSWAEYLLREESLRFTVWSEGYAEARVQTRAREEPGWIEVGLERGSPPALTGFVLEGGLPVPGARVDLLRAYPHQWTEDEATVVALLRTGDDGSFTFTAPAERYLLRVTAGEMRHVRSVDLPAPAPLEIELTQLPRIVVDLFDGTGRRPAGHTVVLHGTDGRQRFEHTDEAGRKVFEHLAPGAYQVHVPPVSTDGSFSGGLLRDVQLAAGETRRVEIEVPAVDQPRFGRLVGAGDYAGWRARLCAPGIEEWTEVELDGRLPIDLNTAKMMLEVENPRRQRWEFALSESLPADAAVTPEFDVRVEGLRLRGVLVDEGGRALAGVRVLAAELDSGNRREVSALSGGDGGFELTGLDDFPYLLSFNPDGARPVWVREREGGDYRQVFFRPTDRPSADPRPIEVRLPGFLRKGNRERGLGPRADPLRGRVLAEATGEPVSDASGWVWGLFDSPHGSLEVVLVTGGVLTGPDGAYQLELPVADRYRLQVWSTAGGLRGALEWRFGEAPDTELRLR